MKKKAPMKKMPKSITAEELDRRFDSGESIMEYLDMDTATYRVNVDFPAWSVTELDRESNRLGVSRQALIKLWIIERLDLLGKSRKKVG
jgi:hypothetical protein